MLLPIAILSKALRSTLLVPASGSSGTKKTRRGCWYAGALASTKRLIASSSGWLPARDDEGHRLRADLVGHRHGARLRNVGVARQHQLHLARKNVLAAGDEHVVGAPTNQCSRSRRAGRRRPVVPALRRQYRRRTLRIVEIAEHHRRRALPEFSFDELQLHAGCGHPRAASGFARPCGSGPNTTRPGLRGAVHVQPWAFGNPSLIWARSRSLTGAEPMRIAVTLDTSVASRGAPSRASSRASAAPR